VGPSFSRPRGIARFGVRAASTFGRWSGGQANTPGYYFTEFNGTEDPISESGVWVRGGTEGLLWTNPRSAGGVCYGNQPGTNGSGWADDSVAHLTGFSANHRVKLVIHCPDVGLVNAFQEIEANLRMAITTNNFVCYECNLGVDGSGVWYIQCWQWQGGLQQNNGSNTEVFPFIMNTVAGTTPVDGSTLEAEIDGNVLRCWINSVLQFSINVQTSVVLSGGVAEGDNPGANGLPYLTTGQPGFGFYSHDDPADNSLAVKSFEAWNL
jgi:hypothetical protein